LAYKTGEFEGIRVEQAVQQVFWRLSMLQSPGFTKFYAFVRHNGQLGHQQCEVISVWPVLWVAKTY
jgi:hypothetical protein